MFIHLTLGKHGMFIFGIIDIVINLILSYKLTIQYDAADPFALSLPSLVVS